MLINCSLWKVQLAFETQFCNFDFDQHVLTILAFVFCHRFSRKSELYKFGRWPSHHNTFFLEFPMSLRTLSMRIGHFGNILLGCYISCAFL